MVSSTEMAFVMHGQCPVEHQQSLKPSLPTLFLGNDNDNEQVPFSQHEKSNRCTPKSKPKRALITSMLILLNILFGIFNTREITFNNNSAAMAAESSEHPNSEQSTSWQTSSSELSEKLFQSLADRPTKKVASQNYWDSMSGTFEDRQSANERLIDGTVAQISTMYYDASGGFNFDAQNFYSSWKSYRREILHPSSNDDKQKRDVGDFASLLDTGFTTRDDAIKSLKYVVSSLHDPYSKYLTREELKLELIRGDDGFLGLGAFVGEAPIPSYSPSISWDILRSRQLTGNNKIDRDFDRATKRNWSGSVLVPSPTEQLTVPMSKTSAKKLSDGMLSERQAANLPIITAVGPDSPAERAGLVVGDRIASVGNFKFTGLSSSQVQRSLERFKGKDGKEYFGYPDLSIAKKISTDLASELSEGDENYFVFLDGWYQPRRKLGGSVSGELVLGYRLSHVQNIPTTKTAKLLGTQANYPAVVGGDSIVHYQLITAKDSIFQQLGDKSTENKPRIGYIRLTRFSKASTDGYLKAVECLEKAGAQSYIVDLRNCYGGVIQEAMLTASTLLRDPHLVLCYTLNSHGGFRPQENQEYIVDTRYPGYLLSSEPRGVSREQVRREHPEFLEEGGWESPTSYASLRELRLTRGIKPAFVSLSEEASRLDKRSPAESMTRKAQKKIVLLINEGTASSAEVFASALHDNGRTTALVGTKSFGKGLIQHTFPMPDGGGLRLTVAEYLTPALQHVNVKRVKPDIQCDSKQGIPQNIGSDLCVGVALDILESEGGV